MAKTEHEDNAYLWDGSGEPDPEIVRLETLLGQLRHQGIPPELPATKPRLAGMADAGEPARLGLTRVVGALSAAAAVLLIASIGWYATVTFRRGWTVQTIAGTGAPSSTARLRVGQWLETD